MLSLHHSTYGFKQFRIRHRNQTFPNQIKCFHTASLQSGPNSGPNPNSEEQAMEVPFRAVFTADLPESWQKTPDPEIQQARARMMGIPLEHMVRRIVFCVPEHPLFIEYEKFLQTVVVPQDQDIVSCVIQNRETWRTQSKPNAFKKLMTSMKETGAPDFDSLGCAEYRNPLPSFTQQ